MIDDEAVGPRDAREYQFSDPLGGEMVDSYDLLGGQEVLPNPHQEESGFIVGGENSTSIIQGLTVIEGKKISDLEERLRPEGSSEAGFIGRNERLLDVLAADNDAVKALGLNHQEVAKPLLTVVILREILSPMSSTSIMYGGKKYLVSYEYTMGLQESPFDERDQAGGSCHIVNESGEELEIELLIPTLIAKYGFYEGDVPYRVAPEKIVHFFDLKPQAPRI